MIMPEDFKSDRLNNEVALFMGCTLNETLMVVGVSFSIASIASIPIVLAVFGMFTLALAFDLLLTAPVFLISLTCLSKLKRGKPAGYYQQVLKIKLSKTGLIKNPYVMRSGSWSTERIMEIKKS